MKALGKLSKRRILAGLMAGAILLALLPGRASSWIRGAVGPLLTPLGDPGMYVTLAFRRQLGNLGHGRSQADPQTLADQVDYYKSMAIYYQFQAQQLRAQLDQRLGMATVFGPVQDLPAWLVPARVVGEDALPYGATRTVNAGSRNGVGRGQMVVLHDRSKAIQGSRLAVVTASALVGQVVESSAFTARVQLVSDRGFKCGANILRLIDPARPRTVTITSGQSASRQTLAPDNNQLLEVEARGDGQGGLVVEDVKDYDQVRPGDLLVTSDQSLLLPVGMRIGTVTAVEDDPKHPQMVRLRVLPDADLTNLREVIIVVPMTGPKAS
jgi:cell shape-determining protein MreC